MTRMDRAGSPSWPLVLEPQVHTDPDGRTIAVWADPPAIGDATARRGSPVKAGRTISARIRRGRDSLGMVVRVGPTMFATDSKQGEWRMAFVRQFFTVATRIRDPDPGTSVRASSRATVVH